MLTNQNATQPAVFKSDFRDKNFPESLDSTFLPSLCNYQECEQIVVFRLNIQRITMIVTPIP
jgi:hypothetical protein